MQIQNDASTFSVWKNYTQHLMGAKKSMSRLSSGLRIQDASDDPAGLAISERLISQYRNASAAAGNVENSVNYLQTADGWLQNVQNMLGRMSELAVSANDATKSAADRQNLQDEFRQMQMEIERVTSGASAAGRFNGIYLFRGGTGVGTDPGGGVAAGSMPVQIGPDDGQALVLASTPLDVAFNGVIGSVHDYTYDSANMSLVASNHYDVTWSSIILDYNNLSISAQASARDALQKLPVAIDYISRQRARIGAETNRLTQTLSGLRDYEDNIRSAASRIRDVDVARETTALTRNQLLTKTGLAALAQGNAQRRYVLKLVG